MKIDSVLVVGCGGLGGFVIEGLARLGVKNLVLMDGDSFCESNMNRQLESGLDTLGKLKAFVYQSRLENKFGIKAKAIPAFLDETNEDVVKSVDVVMDCVDTVSARLFLAKTCEKYGKVLIHGGLEGSQGQACVCFPDDNTIAKLYAGKDEQKHSTNVYTVATIASLELSLLHKLMLGKDDELKNKLILADLDSFAIDTIRI